MAQELSCTLRSHFCITGLRTWRVFTLWDSKRKKCEHTQGMCFPVILDDPNKILSFFLSCNRVLEYYQRFSSSLVLKRVSNQFSSPLMASKKQIGKDEEQSWADTERQQYQKVWADEDEITWE